MKFIHFLDWYLVIFLTLSLNTHLSAATCTTTAPGVWDCDPISEADDLIVNHDVTISGEFILTGSILVNSGATLTFSNTFNPSGSSTTTISGTVDAPNMTLDNNATVTVTSTGTLISNTFFTEDTGGTQTLNVANGGVVNVNGNFNMGLQGTGTIDGILAVSEKFILKGSICGTGLITYGTDPGEGCNTNGGTACGDSDNWCDDSGIITSGTLPIELLWFRGKIQDNEVVLDFATVVEKNNHFFTIERSMDGLTFHELMTLDGAGNSDKILKYSAVDKFPFYGLSYYRLKQTDFDGQYTYSNVVAVIMDHGLQELDFTLFPNPTKDILNLQVMGNAVNFYIEIYNSRGQKIKNVATSRKIYGFELKVEHLNTGIYFVHLINEGYRGVRKFVKE